MAIDTTFLASDISRKFAGLDTFITERKDIQSLMDVSRLQLSKLEAQDKELREQMECIVAEHIFLGADGTSIHDRLLAEEQNPLAPFLRDALVQAAYGIRESIDRIKMEADMIREMSIGVYHEREALNPVLEGQVQALLNSTTRALDLFKEVLDMVEPVRRSLLLALYHA